METHDLAVLFPEGKVKDFPSSDEEHVSIPYGSGFLWLPLRALSDKEKLLIETLMPKPEKNKSLSGHPWYGILFENKASRQTDERFRVLQLKISGFSDGSDYLSLWEENLKEFFPHLADAFFLTETEYILVEKETGHKLYQEELAGIFTTLDADFELTTRVFAGDFYAGEEGIQPLFSEERRLFVEEVQYVKEKNVIQFSDVALHYFTKDKLKNSPIMRNLRGKIAGEDEAFRQLVMTMWKHFGNISSVAKEMYTHRNTINYRIEKIYEQTGINLKNADDLLFCYLMLLVD